MGLSDIWDSILDELDYIIHFEWIGDIGDFFSGFFENITELSLPGIIGGIAMIVLTSLMLGKLDYIQVLDPAAKIFNYGLFFVFAFLLGYFPIKRVFDM